MIFSYLSVPGAHRTLNSRAGAQSCSRPILCHSPLFATGGAADTEIGLAPSNQVHRPQKSTRLPSRDIAASVGGRELPICLLKRNLQRGAPANVARRLNEHRAQITTSIELRRLPPAHNMSSPRVCDICEEVCENTRVISHSVRAQLEAASDVELTGSEQHICATCRFRHCHHSYK